MQGVTNHVHKIKRSSGCRGCAAVATAVQQNNWWVSDTSANGHDQFKGDARKKQVNARHCKAVVQQLHDDSKGSAPRGGFLAWILLVLSIANGLIRLKSKMSMSSV